MNVEGECRRRFVDPGAPCHQDTFSACVPLSVLAFSVKLESGGVGGPGLSYSHMTTEDEESTLLVGPVRKISRRDFTFESYIRLGPILLHGEWGSA